MLSDDDVDYLMAEMNNALEPAFAVLEQDHEMMLKCFEFVSRVDDLYNAAKGGVGEGETKEPDTILMEQIAPLPSPSAQQAKISAETVEQPDAALSAGAAALVRVLLALFLAFVETCRSPVSVMLSCC